MVAGLGFEIQTSSRRRQNPVWVHRTVAVQEANMIEMVNMFDYKVCVY